MTTTLDSILSGEGASASEQGNNEQEQVTQTEQLAEAKETVEAERTEGESGGQKMVPHEALHAEKQKVKRYTEEVADFRRSNEALTRQVSELLQRVPVPKQEQPAAPDFFENPQAATRHEVEQAVSPQLQQFNQVLLSIAKDNAVTRFTEETVDEAERAFISAMQGGKLDQADYQKVVGSPNRYAAAVQWHKRQQAQAEIGDDPAKYREKLEAEIREKVLAEINGGNQPAQQRQAPVMPSNLAGARNVGARSGPAWSGPTPLNDIFSRSRPSG